MRFSGENTNIQQEFLIFPIKMRDCRQNDFMFFYVCKKIEWKKNQFMFIYFGSQFLSDLWRQTNWREDLREITKLNNRILISFSPCCFILPSPYFIGLFGQMLLKNNKKNKRDVFLKIKKYCLSNNSIANILYWYYRCPWCSYHLSIVQFRVWPLLFTTAVAQHLWTSFSNIKSCI